MTLGMLGIKLGIKLRLGRNFGIIVGMKLVCCNVGIAVGDTEPDDS